MNEPNEPATPNDSQPLPVFSDYGTDLSAGKVSALTEFGIDDALIENRAKRKMRWIAFLVLGGMCSLYLLVLMYSLATMLGSSEEIAIFSKFSDWHFLLFMTVALVIFAAIPLSLSLALVKMISEKNEEEKNKNDLAITTPQFELFKAIVDAVKALKP